MAEPEKATDGSGRRILGRVVNHERAAAEAFRG
jgi:hypothetical protein